jgi:hypothetical protein
MAVLMRVDVSGIAAHERAEPVELQGDISGNDALECALGPDKRPRSSPNPPPRNLDVKSDRELRVLAGIVCGLERNRTVHHQAGTRHDPALVCLDDPSVDAAAAPEVVGVHDEQFQRRPR